MDLFPEDKWQPKFPLPPGIVLRPYQREWNHNIEQAFKRGVKRQLVVAPTGCHAAGQQVIMFDYSLKKVEDIEVGDRLMGPDGTPRNVLQLCRGTDDMYKITPARGKSFVVNKDHVLALMFEKQDVRCNYTVENYLKLLDYNPYVGNKLKLFYSNYKNFGRYNKEWRKRKFTVSPFGRDFFFGFRLDGDHLYLLDDFLVTHNSGKGGLPYTALQTINKPTLLYLTYTEELVDQALENGARYLPDLKIGLEKAEHYADDDCDLVVCCVPTLGRKTSASRLERFHPERFSIVYADEAHLAVSDTTRRILSHFKPDLLLGATATIKRSDEVPLANIFDEVVFERDLLSLTMEGKYDFFTGPYLSDLCGYRILTRTDISSVASRAGDFNQNELADAINIPERNQKIVDVIENHAQDRKCILIFCVDKNHANEVNNTLQLRGHSSEVILGDTKGREEKTEKFRNGEIRIVCSVSVFSFGFDNPRIDALILASPTKSELLFTQRIGRGTRLFPGKDNCAVFDLVDVCGQHQVVDIASAFGLRSVDFLGTAIDEKAPVLKKAEELGIEVKKESDIEEVEKKVELVQNVLSGEIEVNTKAVAIDIFDAMSMPEEVEHSSLFPWVHLNDKHYAISMMKDGVAEISQDSLGRWMFTYNNLTILKSTGGNLFKWADNLVKNHAPRLTWMARAKSSSWYKKPMSNAQRDMLKKFSHINVFPDNLSMGSASYLLDRLLLHKRFYGKQKKLDSGAAF